MEHGTSAQRARTRGVAARARARVARGAGVRLRDAVRAALARLAEPWLRVRAAWAAALERVAAARVRLERARRVMRAAGVAWQDPAPVSVDASRRAWGGAPFGRSSSPTPIYGQVPSGMRFTDEASPDLRPRRLCSTPVDIAQHHLDTAPTPTPEEASLAAYRAHRHHHTNKDQR